MAGKRPVSSKQTARLAITGALIVAVGLLAAGNAGAARASLGPHSADAAKEIKSAIAYEEMGIKAAAKGDWTAVHQDLNNKGIGARESLHLAENDLSTATYTGEIESAALKTIDSDLNSASALDRKAATAAGRKDANSVKVLVTKAIAAKEAGLSALEKATPATPAGVTFGITFSHAFGAGPSSSNDCEQVTVTEHGVNVTPTGTLELTGPSGFDMTNPLSFAPSGTGVFVAPSTFLLTAFGPYTENAKITVGGVTNTQTGTWTISASNDQTTGGCQVP